MTAAIDSMIAALQSGRLADPNGLKEWATRHRALPVVFDMGGCYAISASGAVISFAWDRPDEVRVEEDERIRNLVFAEAAQKHQELRSLKPVRPPDAATCSFCQGTGRPTGTPRPRSSSAEVWSG